MKWLRTLVDRRVALLVGGAALLTDLLSKELVITLIPVGDHVTAGPLLLQHARNPGVALGTFGGLPEGVRMALVLVGVVLALLVALPWLAARVRAGAAKQAAVALVVTGALGNLADRFRYGSVIDFIGLDPALGIPSPVFNLADVAIVAGALMLLWGAWRHGKRGGHRAAHEPWPGMYESGPVNPNDHPPRDSAWVIITGLPFLVPAYEAITVAPAADATEAATTQLSNWHQGLRSRPIWQNATQTKNEESDSSRNN